jgi:hypothetical protein
MLLTSFIYNQLWAQGEPTFRVVQELHIAVTDLPFNSILFTYPEIAGIAGLQGVLVYAFASALPFLTFPPLAKRIRQLCPHGFVLTEYVRERFGLIAMLFLSGCSCLTMWVYGDNMYEGCANEDD